ncbi:hypothetical protein ACFSN5_01830 [Streptococcus tangpeifui]|uniref:hypothetical protein n=1 Tax=Streptococcus tangpeifui TaxID=2709400 RepID=UPI0013EDB7EB|nr:MULTISPECIES: hypothetical protein [unclassified Streptococcus]
MIKDRKLRRIVDLLAWILVAFSFLIGFWSDQKIIAVTAFIAITAVNLLQFFSDKTIEKQSNDFMEKKNYDEKIATAIALIICTVSLTYVLWPISKSLSVVFFILLMLINIYLFLKK